MGQIILNIFIILTIINGIFGQKYPCSIHLSVNINNGDLHPNGSWIHDNLEYPPDHHFMYDPAEGEQHEAQLFNSSDFMKKHRRGCVCELKNCYRKCCPQNQSINKGECEDIGLELEENVTDHQGNHLPNAFKDFEPVFDIPCLQHENFMLETGDYFFFENGSFFLTDAIVDISEYCIEKALTENNEVVSMAYVCLTEESKPSSSENTKHILDSIGMILSVPFLLATLIVYIILPELQTLNGKSLMCYIGSLTIAYTVLIVIKLESKISDRTCLALGFSAYYAFMLSFFWLNVISYDIWWTFSGFKGYRGRALTSEKRKFIYFCMYAFGATIYTSIVTLSLHFYDYVPSQYKSVIGENCWFKDESILLYFYGPLIFLTAWNIFFFSHTAYKIYSNTRLTGVLRREGSTKHGQTDSDKQRFWLYIKLFLIMGVTWTMEFLSWAVGGPAWAWIITDIINTLQGVLIFVFFVWKPKIKRLLRRKTNVWRKVPGHETSYSTGNTPSKSNTTQLSMRNFSRADSTVADNS